MKEVKKIPVQKKNNPIYFTLMLVFFIFLLIAVYFTNQKDNNYSYKSKAQEVPAQTEVTSNTGEAPKYNCGALCDKVFKIAENKKKCINPCNKVGDKKAEGMECRQACDKSIKNGARKQFCYKFCPAIEVGAAVEEDVVEDTPSDIVPTP